ncbi:MAG: BPL-N domain-containing protein [Candidatus Hermodarchaeota archaeon]
MSKRIKHWNFIVMMLFLNVLIPVSSTILKVEAHSGLDLQGVKVAIYCNTVSDETLDSRIALQNMFHWMNASIENITAVQIREGKLSNYNIFVLPGRSESLSLYEMQNSGVTILLDYIRSGGAYFGVCGGTNFAALNDVNLFSGNLIPVPGEVISSHIVEMRLNSLSKEPSLTGLNESFSILFWGSTYFYPDASQQFNTIAYYENSNKPGMITFRYGLGAVFLSSPHGEFEENNERDGTDEFDVLNDEDSEWNLYLRISQWLVSVPKDNIILIWLISVTCGSLGIGFLMILKKYRKH